MALKGMEAYMDSDEDVDLKESPSSYSTISNDEDLPIELNGRRSQEPLPPSDLDLGGTRSEGDSADLFMNPKTLYGFPQNLDLTDEEKVTIPEDTARSASPYLEGKIVELIAKQKRHNLDVNYEIQKSKAFRNPSIYQKLIEYCEIDEFGSNFDTSDFDPRRWTDASSMESLAKAQSIFMEKYEKEKKSKGPEVGVKRKTKWDSDPKVGTNRVAVSQGITKISSSGNLAKSSN